MRNYMRRMAEIFDIDPEDNREVQALKAVLEWEMDDHKLEAVQEVYGAAIPEVLIYKKVQGRNTTFTDLMNLGARCFDSPPNEGQVKYRHQSVIYVYKPTRLPLRLEEGGLTLVLAGVGEPCNSTYINFTGPQNHGIGEPEDHY